MMLDRICFSSTYNKQDRLIICGDFQSEDKYLIISGCSRWQVQVFWILEMESETWHHKQILQTDADVGSSNVFIVTFHYIVWSVLICVSLSLIHLLYISAYTVGLYHFVYFLHCCVTFYFKSSNNHRIIRLLSGLFWDVKVECVSILHLSTDTERLHLLSSVCWTRFGFLGSQPMERLQPPHRGQTTGDGHICWVGANIAANGNLHRFFV